MATTLYHERNVRDVVSFNNLNPISRTWNLQVTQKTRMHLKMIIVKEITHGNLGEEGQRKGDGVYKARDTGRGRCAVSHKWPL